MQTKTSPAVEAASIRKRKLRRVAGAMLVLFGASFGIAPPGWRTVGFTTLTETWKADWP